MVRERLRRAKASCLVYRPKIQKERLERMERGKYKKDSELYQQIALNERMSDLAINKDAEEGDKRKDGVRDDRDRRDRIVTE